MDSLAKSKDYLLFQPTSLQEAINMIQFLTTKHKEEISGLKEAYQKQTEFVRILLDNRKKELNILSTETHKSVVSLTLRNETVKKQLDEKDEIIQRQLDKIEELTKKLQAKNVYAVPEIVIGDSNSDSGIAMEHDESTSKIPEIKTEKIKSPSRKCSRRFADSINFLRRVDFSPMKYKPSPENNKNKEEKNLEARVDKRVLTRQLSNDIPISQKKRLINDEAVHSDGESIFLRPKNNNDSMNNYFSDDGSDDTSEEVFDRVMTRSSVRQSVKANPKYKKINRTKSKLLGHTK